MAKLTAKSSGGSSVSSGRFDGSVPSPESYLQLQFESYASSCSGALTKKGWRAFLSSARCYDTLKDVYFDYVLTPFADKTFLSFSKGLARSQATPLQLTLDSEVISLPPVLMASDSEVKGNKIYSTLRDSTLKHLRFHIDHLAEQLVKKQRHLDALENAYAHFFRVVRGDMSARLRDVVKLFQSSN